MTNGPTSPSQSATPEEIYGIFAGYIDQLAVQKLSNAFNIASNNNVKRVHLIFQSAGGIIGDGICLYNLFKVVPFELLLYNIGQISSIGVIAFLGAQKRKASANANFMLHRTTAAAQTANSERLHSIAHSLILDDERTEAILKQLNLSAEHWATHKVADLWLSATEALDAGVIDEIKNFAPPKGSQIFYLGPNV